MTGDDFQNKLYKNLYKNKQYLDALPDLKITGGIKVEGKNILTIGSGTARDIWYLVQKNKIVALDNSPEVTKILNSKGIEVKIAGLEKKLDFKSMSFDIVIAKDILEHLTYPLEICREIRRVLKPDGYAVINVPNHFCLPMRLKYLFGGNLIWKTPGINHEKTFDEWNYMHLRYFSWSGFKKLIELSGMEISKTFFDIFTLNHYTDPDLVRYYLKNNHKSSAYTVLLNSFDFIFPRRIRRIIAGLNPNLISGSFYVWVKPV